MIVDSIAGGKAFADISDLRKIGVTGADALDWLDELVTGDVASLGPGRSAACLLLDDAGGLRASVTVAVSGSSVLVLQDRAQPRSVLDLLTIYTEGSDVELEDRSEALAIFSFPGRRAAPDLGGTAYYSPSALGPGADIVCMPEDRARLAASLAKSFATATPDDLEAWRIIAGRPRMGVDAFEGDLPQEAGLMGPVATGKAHFLGRDAVTAIDDSTPLRKVVVALRTAEPVSPGEELRVGGQVAGELTSVTGTEEGVVGLARVFWEHRNGPFLTGAGVTLMARLPV